jgi:hypothetical protein
MDKQNCHEHLIFATDINYISTCIIQKRFFYFPLLSYIRWETILDLRGSSKNNYHVISLGIIIPVQEVRRSVRLEAFHVDYMEDNEIPIATLSLILFQSPFQYNNK